MFARLGIVRTFGSRDALHKNANVVGSQVVSRSR